MQFNILIIDDEKNIREGLSDALELEGYNTFIAETNLIDRNKNISNLTLITCTKNSKTSQTVYVSELIGQE